MQKEAAEAITKIMMIMPQLSEKSQMRLVGVAEGMEIALQMQQKERKEKEDEKS